MTFLRAAIFYVISERMAKALRGDLFDSIVEKDVEYFDSRKTGDLCNNNSLNYCIVSRLSSDTTVI